MSRRGKSRGRTGKVKEENVSPDVDGVGSIKEPDKAFAPEFSVIDWQIIIDQEETELFIAAMVEEWVENVLDMWYERYLDRASIPYVWQWYKSNLLDLVRLDQLAPDPGEDPLTDSCWEPDPEPVATLIDSWAPAAVPFITRSELQNIQKENINVMKSPLEFDVDQSLRPLVSDSTVCLQISSALKQKDVTSSWQKKNLETCMDDYSSSDMSIVTAPDSCDWWKWAQKRRLDRQTSSQSTSQSENAARRIIEASPEPLSGNDDQENAYRGYMKWVELVDSDEEEDQQVEPRKAVSCSYQAGARVEYQGIDLWETAEKHSTSNNSVEEPAPPLTPSTMISECASCCTALRDIPTATSAAAAASASTKKPTATISMLLPAIQQLRALKLSRCSGLLARSESSSNGDDRLPPISLQVDDAAYAQPASAAKKKSRTTAVGHGPDPGHYEQIDVNCELTEMEKWDGKKTAPQGRLRGIGRPAARRKSKPQQQPLQQQPSQQQQSQEQKQPPA